MEARGVLDAGQLEQLIDAGRGLVSELDLSVLLEDLLGVAAGITGARYAALGILDEERRRLERFLTHGIDPEARAAISELPRGRGILGALVEDPRPLRLGDVSRDPRSYGFPPGHPPMRSFLGLPILIRGQAWGNLYLTEKDAGEFTAGDEQAVVVLAEWAAIAIENARLYAGSERRRHELEQAVRRLEATHAIARAVGGETDLARVLAMIVERGRALVEARGMLILLYRGDELVVAASTGDVPESANGDHPGRVVAPTGEVLTTRSPETLGTTPSDPGDWSVALGIDAGTALGVPLDFRGRPLGVLVAVGGRGAGERFGPDDESLLVAFAASAATAVATARSVEEQRLRQSLAAADAERARWSRELHDETLQGLGALRMLLSSARRRGDHESLTTAVHAAVAQIDDEIESLRGLIRELRPAALDELGPGPAIEDLAARVAARHGITVTTSLDLDGSREHPEIETAVYRLIQEALTNAVKHARATGVGVTVTREEGRLRVVVADDGVGFDAGRPKTGYGLAGMRERVALVGGTLSITSAAGGTTVEASLPVGSRAGR